MNNRNVAELFRLCTALGWKIATAESCTGGLLAAALTDAAGASDVFDRGFVTYSNAAKSDMLGVDPATLARFGAVSEPVALEMAQGAAVAAGADLAISITGIAGPGGSTQKPEGRVCFALVQGHAPPDALTREFGAIGRDKVRQNAVHTALTMMIKTAQTAAGQHKDTSALSGN